MERWISAGGLLVMMALAWILSSDRRRVSLRIVFGGLVLQVAFAVLVLKTTPGVLFFEGARQLFVAVLNCVDHGAAFLFGEGFREHYFAFKVLSSIVFFAALTSVLHHFGVVQFVVRRLGWVMQKTLGTSGAESLAAAANVFVGHTEAPLVVRPYLERMTRSELMALMVGGFATVAGGVMAAYIEMGIDAGHLLTASVISAPAALLIAKIMQPEVETPVSVGTEAAELKPTTINVLDAMATGATDGLRLALNVGAMVVAFLAMIALIDLGLGRVGGLFGQEWSLALFLGYVFAPFAWVMGVEQADVFRVGQLLGLKTVSNEFIAYQRLAEYSDLAPRSQIIATYALCGFANFGSVGVQIGGLGALAPSRKADLARLGLRAMIGGTLAAFMTACIAGMMI